MTPIPSEIFRGDLFLLPVLHRCAVGTGVRRELQANCGGCKGCDVLSTHRAFHAHNDRMPDLQLLTV